VGHEVDVMISDFVADLRAPTPSASIEMILPDKNEVLYTLGEKQEQFSRLMKQKIEHFSREASYHEQLLLQVSPKRQLESSEALARQLAEAWSRAMRVIVEKKVSDLALMSKTLEMNNPKNHLKKGWSQTSIEGKRVALSMIQSNDKFILEDGFTKIEAFMI
jgi:exodeoxyribonuclease VII large subunit